MADRRIASDGLGDARRMIAKPVLRLAGRIAAAALGVLVVAMVSIQFSRVIARDIGEARELSSVNAQIVDLQKRQVQQQADIRRLRDPAGAVPEIHDRLRMVRSNEELIFISPAPLPTR